jgi:hypothetical protein
VNIRIEDVTRERVKRARCPEKLFPLTFPPALGKQTRE